MALYTKYRPQRFADIVSHDAIKETLKKALADNKLTHAVLLVGPRGIGKTSLARLIAKSLNCERPKDGEPCDTCSSCKAVTLGSHIDVIEIDAASNRGIDEIRELKEKIKMRPALGRKKVYIIDEVHMLTKEAFNALLKTLEEPPAHVSFILATTEGHKVPATIVSRTLRFDLKRAEAKDIEASLVKIAKAESLKVENSALKIIADMADGAFRDALSMLEQVAAYAGGKEISEKLLEEALALPDISAILALVKSMAIGSAPEVMHNLNKVFASTTNVEEIARIWLSVWKELLILAVSQKDPEITGKLRHVKELQDIAALTEPQILISCMEKLMECGSVAKYSSVPALTYELLALEANSKLGDKRAEPAKETEVVNVVKQIEVADFDWAKIVAKVKEQNATLAAVLRDAEPAIENGALRLYCQFAFHANKIKDLKSRLVIEKIVEECTGMKTKVEVVLGKNIAAADKIDLEKAVSEVFEVEK